MKTSNYRLIAVRIKTDQKTRIEELAERHELPESIVIRKALDTGLQKFDRENPSTNRATHRG